MRKLRHTYSQDSLGLCQPLYLSPPLFPDYAQGASSLVTNYSSYPSQNQHPWKVRSHPSLEWNTHLLGVLWGTPASLREGQCCRAIGNTDHCVRVGMIQGRGYKPVSPTGSTQRSRLAQTHRG